MDKEQKYLEIWRRSRDSVEHFDRILTELRKTLIAVNGAAMPILVSLFLSSLPDKKVYIVFFSFALNLVDIVFWFVEKHYHIYLVVAANVCKRIEDLMGVEEEISLTENLAKEKLQIPLTRGFLSFYDFIYLLPAAVSLAIPFMTNSFKLKLIASVFLVVELFFGWKIVNRNSKAERAA